MTYYEQKCNNSLAKIVPKDQDLDEFLAPLRSINLAFFGDNKDEHLAKLLELHDYIEANGTQTDKTYFTRECVRFFVRYQQELEHDGYTPNSFRLAVGLRTNAFYNNYNDRELTRDALRDLITDPHKGINYMRLKERILKKIAEDEEKSAKDRIAALKELTKAYDDNADVKITQNIYGDKIDASIGKTNNAILNVDKLKGMNDPLLRDRLDSLIDGTIDMSKYNVIEVEPLDEDNTDE